MLTHPVLYQQLIITLRTDMRIDQLRSSIERLGVDQTHTLRGLDSYQKGIDQAANEDKFSATNGPVFNLFHSCRALALTNAE
jgi:hypothetical protein